MSRLHDMCVECAQRASHFFSRTASWFHTAIFFCNESVCDESWFRTVVMEHVKSRKDTQLTMLKLWGVCLCSRGESVFVRGRVWSCCGDEVGMKRTFQLVID